MEKDARTAEALVQVASVMLQFNVALVRCRQQVEAGNAGASVSVQRDRAQA